MWGTKISADFQIRGIKDNLEKEFTSLTTQEIIEVDKSSIIHFKDWFAELCDTNRHKRLRLETETSRRIYLQRTQRITTKADTSLGGDLFLTSVTDKSRRLFHDQNLRSSHQLPCSSSQLDCMSSSENRYEFESRVRERLLHQYDELLKVRDKLAVGLKGREIQSEKVYRKENLLTQELSSLVRLHTKWTNNSLSTNRSSLLTLRKTQHVQLDALRKQKIQGRRSCEEDQAEMIEVLADIQKLQRIMKEQTEQIDLLTSEEKRKLQKIQQVHASSKLIHQLVNVQRYLAQGKTAQNIETINSDEPCEQISFSQVTQHILNFYNEQTNKNRELSNHYTELLTDKTELNGKLKHLISNEQDIRSYLPHLTAETRDPFSEALSEDREKLDGVARLILRFEEYVLSLLKRLKNVLVIELKGWQRYQKNIREFVDVRLTQGSRDISTNLDQSRVAVLLQRYFQNHHKYSFLSIEMAVNKLITTHISPEIIAELLAETVRSKKKNVKLNTVKELERLPIRLNEICCDKISQKTAMMLGLIRDIMELMKNPPKNFAIRSQRRLRTKRVSRFDEQVYKEPKKSSQILKTAETETNINSATSKEESVHKPLDAMFLYRQLRKIRGGLQ